jgi:D-beta-D-heptose 7-phosphate kinase/D-beta-D-heptose 1-phosphate adenosyltransferase
MDFSALSVLCMGEVMLDRFMYGEMDRISPEAPVPVVRLTGITEMLGGAGNVANNIVSLGGRAVLIGLVGHDVAGETLSELSARRRGISAALVTTDARPTICKTRLVAAGQQVVRVDEESRASLSVEEDAGLRAALDEHIGAVQALILSDYGKGLLSPELLAYAVEAARGAGIPVLVDPKARDFTRYHRATCITPNLKELAAASGMPVGSDTEVAAAARRVMRDAQAAAVLVTRSEHGMLLVEADGTMAAVPARAREVFDVSGAGDTVIAALTLAHASGRTLAQAMHIANAAAGVVVAKSGTATADLAEVMYELQEQAEDGRRVALPELQSLPRVQTMVARWKQQGLRVGFTNGCFDVLHSGHVSLLADARTQCDRLVVALNSDSSVRRLKGPSRPVNSLKLRAKVIAAIRSVDCVTSFAEETPLEIIQKLVPDVLIKGADYTADQIVGRDVVEAAGGRVYLARLVPDQSTTGTIFRLNGGPSQTSDAPIERVQT